MHAYICHTMYHLLISLIKCSFEKQALLILSDVVPHAKYYQERIEEQFDHIEVCFVLEADLQGTRFHYPKAVHDRVRRLLDGVTRIHVFNDTYALPLYFHRQNIAYHLLEDGYNALQHPNSLPKKRHYKQWLLEGKPLPHGFSSACQTIEVNDLANLPRGRRSSKFVAVPRQPLFARLSESTIQRLLTIFEIKKIEVATWSLLVLTQPLAQDGYVADAKEQIAYYRAAIQPYLQAGYQVYFKVHPRDHVNYSTLPVQFIAQDIPVELLDFVVKQPFKKGITAFSTALNFLQCVDEKQFLMEFG